MFYPNYTQNLMPIQPPKNRTKQKAGNCSMGLTQKQKETLRRNNEESNQVTREAIGCALQFLMETQAFDKIKISDIIRRSGVSRSAFYRNYKTKEEILYDAVRTVQDILLTNASNSLPDSWEMTFRFLRCYKKQLNLIIKAGLEHHLLIQMNKSLDFSSNLDFKEAMYNGLFYNIIIYWAKSGMLGTDKDAAEMVLKSYRGIMEDVQTYS